MVDLNDLWMPKFEDAGPFRDERGRWVMGADPQWAFEDGRWWLCYTHGPTAPERSGSPGIYRRASSDRQTGYSAADIILAPDGSPREWGYETISFDYVEPLAAWYGLLMKYGRGKTDTRLVPITAKKISGAWEMHDQHEVAPMLSWELGMISEPGVCYSPHYHAIISSYSTKSLPPMTRRATSIMWSMDGRNYNRMFTPFAQPPGFFEDDQPNSVRSYSQSALIEDPRHPGILHCLTTQSGNLPMDQKGIIQWVLYEDGAWHRNPDFLITVDQIPELATTGWGHIGAPSIYWDYELQQWFLACGAHDHRAQPRIRIHLRLLTEKQS